MTLFNILWVLVVHDSTAVHALYSAIGDPGFSDSRKPILQKLPYHAANYVCFLPLHLLQKYLILLENKQDGATNPHGLDGH
jgi:hypothetical protein